MTASRLGQHRSGFSVVELTLVALIVGIIAAAAVPRFSDALARYRTDAAAQRVAADLNYARQVAMNHGVTQPVAFTLATNSYSMANTPHPDSPGLTYDVDLMSTQYPATLAVVDFGGSTTVTFDIFGLPDAGGSVTVDSDGNQRIVNLDAVTGVATVQ